MSETEYVILVYKCIFLILLAVVSGFYMGKNTFKKCEEPRMMKNTFGFEMFTLTLKKICNKRGIFSFQIVQP